MRSVQNVRTGTNKCVPYRKLPPTPPSERGEGEIGKNMKKRIYLSSPHMSDEGYEIQYIKESFDSNWIAPVGNNIDRFEAEIADFVGVKSAIALNSGTAAIHLALISLGIKPGDIVFCQSLTFVATCNPIIYQGATPVFIDSDVETWNMCPNALEEAFKKHLNNLPKAVIVVHLYGLAANIDEIINICEKYNVPIIEDAAESLGTKYKGKQTGSFGKFGILSFNGNKIITTSGGGMLLSNDEKSIEKARFWATQSRDPKPFYQHSELGYNYRISNVLAGIGRGQLKIIEQRIDKKKYIFDYYKANLTDFNFMPIMEWNEPNYWISCISNICQEKENRYSPNEIINSLEKQNIEARRIWKPMHQQPFFKDYDFVGGDVADKIFNEGLCLPSDTKMSDSDLERVVEIMKCTIK